MGKLLKVAIILPRYEAELGSIALDGCKNRSGFIAVKDVCDRIHLEPIAYTKAIIKTGKILRSPSLRTVRTHECECEKCGKIVTADFAVLKASGVPRGKKVRVEELEKAICPTCGSPLHEFKPHVFSEESIPENFWDLLNPLWEQQDDEPTTLRRPYVYGAVNGIVHPEDYQDRSSLFLSLLYKAQDFLKDGYQYPLYPKGIDDLSEEDKPLNLWLLAPEISVGSLSFEELLALKNCGTPRFPQFLGVRLPKLPPKPKTKNIPFGVNIVL